MAVASPEEVRSRTTMKMDEEDQMPPFTMHPVRIFGRRPRPAGFALALSMLVISWAAFADVGVLDGSRWADALGVGSLASAVVLTVGWTRHSWRLYSAALLFAFFVWVSRFLLVILVANNPISTEGLWLSLGWAALAGGSYFMEQSAFDDARKKGR